MNKRKWIIFVLLFALVSCKGTEITGAVVDKYAQGTTYALDVLDSDGNVHSIGVTAFVWADARLAHVYRFYCDKDGPFCRVQPELYTTEWARIIDDYIAAQK